MEFGAHDELRLLGLLAALAILLVLAPRLHLPYPILLVLGGVGLGFAPGLPEIELPPDLVLVAVLPPLLYASAFFTSLRDLRANVRPISLLAVGLVLATTVTVAIVAHAVVDGMPWAAAFALGAIVSPTDPIAATAIASRLGVPRRLIAIVEGESLVNDGTALVAYKTAVAAAVAGSFSLWSAGGKLVGGAVGGVLVGLAVGYVIKELRRRVEHPPTSITIALLSGYFAFLPAEVLGLSGVLAAVTVGVYMGWHTPLLTNVQARLQGAAVWEILVFLLNSLLFTLVGLQLRPILDELSGRDHRQLALEAAAVCATVVLVRILWVFPATYVPRFLFRRIRAVDPYPHWTRPAFVSWVGMRGAVSLAAALALPLETDAGAAFPERDLIVFLVFCVIVTTLVVQGLSLPLVIRALGLEDDGLDAREEAKARIKAAAAAIERLDELVVEDWVRDDTAERLRGLYGFRRDRFAARFDDGDDGAIEEQSTAYQRLRRELLEAERRAVVALRNEGLISDAVLHRVERDLDLEDSRLDV